MQNINKEEYEKYNNENAMIQYEITNYFIPTPKELIETITCDDTFEVFNEVRKYQIEPNLNDVVNFMRKNIKLKKVQMI